MLDHATWWWIFFFFLCCEVWQMACKSSCFDRRGRVIVSVPNACFHFTAK
jgi:hypothetical protein